MTRALLAVTVLVAAFLRFHDLGGPSYWLDEILHQQLTTKAAAEPWWRWIRALHDEHGSLYYLTQLATRLFGTSEAAGRSAAALFGVATVPVVWAAGRWARPAAILLAVSPLHVYFSREARGYSLLMLLTAALIVVLLRARSLRSLIAVLIATLYTAAVAVPVVASALVVSLLCALLTRERWFRHASIACGVTLALFPVIYAAKPVEDPTWPGFPGLTYEFFEKLLRTLTVSALGTHGSGWVAVAMLALAIAGAVVLARRNATHAIVVIGMTVLPLGAAIASLKVFDHFFAGRYITPALIGFVMLIGAGLSAIRYEAAGLIAAILLTTQTWTAARVEPFQKLDWRAIAQTIWKYAKPDEIIIAAEPWSEVSLRHYLEQLPPRAQLVHIFAPDVADVQRQIRAGAWLVTAGFSADPRVRHWMCRYPLILAAKLEDFRLHYASRAIDGNAPLFFTEGWAAPEGGFRWASAKRATVTIPRWSTHDERIAMRVLPMAHPSLPPQTMRVSLNSHVIGSVVLPNEWTDQSFVAPGRFWINGANTLAFDFGHAVAPASLDSSVGDERTLAVSFESLTLGRPLARITALLPLTREETRFPRVRPEAFIRLGFDPSAVRGVRFEDLAQTLTWDEDCGGDVRLLVRALLDRDAKPHELRELGAMPRERAIETMLKWDETRAKAAP